jgi:hypothetical protein
MSKRYLSFASLSSFLRLCRLSAARGRTGRLFANRSEVCLSFAVRVERAVREKGSRGRVWTRSWSRGDSCHQLRALCVESEPPVPESGGPAS